MSEIKEKKRNKKLVLKIAANEWKNASRDMRELSVVKELGADVLVMAKGNLSGQRENVNGFEVYRMATRPLGKKTPKFLNRLLSVFIWAYQARKFKPDIISCHDLIPLYIGWMSTLFIGKDKRPKLIYDSHEFTIYDGKKTKIQQIIITVLEGFLIKKCEFTIEVNDLIADEVQRIHKLKKRPIVVRNVPNKWTIDPKICMEMREELIKEFTNRGGAEYFILMYHGAIARGRGIEKLIRLIEKGNELVGVILGDGDESYVKDLKELAESICSGKILFHPAVEQSQLWKYAGAVDLGMILAPLNCKNDLYSLPNKFFENIQSETPILCPNYPAMIELVEKYNIGIACEINDDKEILRNIEKIRNKKCYSEYKKSIKRAKEDLCWEKEKVVLKNYYEKII